MELNKFQAAKAVGVSRTTLDRHIKQGKLSVKKDGRGRLVIDVSELERVYTKVDTGGTSKNVSGGQTETVSVDNALQREVELLRERLEAVETERTRERRQLENVIDDLRQDRDHWRDQAKQATALLTHEQEQPKPRPQASTGGGIFSFLRR